MCNFLALHREEVNLLRQTLVNATLNGKKCGVESNSSEFKKLDAHMKEIVKTCVPSNIRKKLTDKDVEKLFDGIGFMMFREMGLSVMATMPEDSPRLKELLCEK